MVNPHLSRYSWRYHCSHSYIMLPQNLHIISVCPRKRTCIFSPFIYLYYATAIRTSAHVDKTHLSSRRDSSWPSQCAAPTWSPHRTADPAEEENVGFTPTQTLNRHRDKKPSEAEPKRTCSAALAAMA